MSRGRSSSVNRRHVSLWWPTLHLCSGGQTRVPEPNALRQDAWPFRPGPRQDTRGLPRSGWARVPRARVAGTGCETLDV